MIKSGLSSWAGASWGTASTAFGTTQFAKAIGTGSGCLVSGGGILGKSTDAINWTLNDNITKAGFGGIAGLAYSPSLGLYAAGLNGGRLATSPDGVTWTERTVVATIFGATEGVTSLIWAGTQFIGVGSHNKCITSPDGINWTERTGLSAVTGTTQGGTVMAWNGTRVVSASENTGGTAYSSDGITWTLCSGFTLTFCQGMVWTGTKFVAVNGTNCLTSTDGITWTSNTGLSSIAVSAVYLAVNGSGFLVATGFGTACATSPDGVTWTSRAGNMYSAIGASVQLSALCWTGSKFFAGATQSRAAYSTDGITWTPSVVGPDSFGSIPIYGIAVNGSNAVLVGTGKGATTPTTNTGAGLTVRPSFGTAFNVNNIARAVVNHNGKFIAIGQWSGCVTSMDGITWTTQSGLGNAIGGQDTWSISSNGTTCVVGGFNGRSATSTDGVTWTYQANSLAVIGAWHLYATCWMGTKFVLAGEGSKLATSPTGVTWTLQTGLATALGSSATIRGVAWSGSTLMVVGDSGVCATSPDGVTWTNRPALATCLGSVAANAVTWSGSKFVVAASSGKVASSVDGITWVLDTTITPIVGTTNLYAVFASATATIVAGGNGTYAITVN